MTCLSLIAAIARNRTIGLNNTLPWHLPEDLRHFRALTTGHHIIMGRKTYESLGRLLPERSTVIVTHNTEYAIDGAVVAHTLEQALEASAGDDEAFIIGGARLYQDGLKLAQKMYITEIDADFAGDVFFSGIRSCRMAGDQARTAGQRARPAVRLRYLRAENLALTVFGPLPGYTIDEIARLAVDHFLDQTMDVSFETREALVELTRELEVVDDLEIELLTRNQ